MVGWYLNRFKCSKLDPVGLEQPLWMWHWFSMFHNLSYRCSYLIRIQVLLTGSLWIKFLHWSKLHFPDVSMEGDDFCIVICLISTWAFFGSFQDNLFSCMYYCLYQFLWEIFQMTRNIIMGNPDINGSSKWFMIEESLIRFMVLRE